MEEGHPLAPEQLVQENARFPPGIEELSILNEIATAINPPCHWTGS